MSEEELQQASKSDAEQVEMEIGERNSIMSLAEIKEFALTFGKKRKSLGISQADLVHELRKLNDPLFTELAISRFEKLDITPRSGSRIKPVLERIISSNELKLAER